MQVLKILATGLARTGFTDVAGAVLVAAAADASVVLADGLTAGDGTKDKGGAAAVLKTSAPVNMFGAQFADGVFVTLSGTGAVLYIYFN